jgi:hypothetical protein
MGFYHVLMNRSVSTEANRGLTSYIYLSSLYRVIAHFDARFNLSLSYYLLGYATEHTRHAEAVVSTYFYYYNCRLETP